MSVKIHCPDCNGIWMLDGGGGGEIICPSCLSRIELTETVAAGAGASLTGAATSAAAAARPAAAARSTPVADRDKGEGVVESWDPKKRRLTGRFAATRRVAGKTWSIQGTFDAAFAGE